jgi:hypothetical protein
LAGAIVFRDARARFHFASQARREARAVLASDQRGRPRHTFELFGFQVFAARDAVDVPMVVIVTAGFAFFLALRESLLPLNHGAV